MLVLLVIVAVLLVGVLLGRVEGRKGERKEIRRDSAQDMPNERRTNPPGYTRGAPVHHRRHGTERTQYLEVDAVLPPPPPYSPPNQTGPRGVSAVVTTGDETPIEVGN